MDYQTFVSTEFVPRIVAAFNGLRTNLSGAGVPVNNITVTEVNPDGDMRWQITARRGARTLVAYLELTATAPINDQMGLVLTLHIEGNGTQIPTSYTIGSPVAYNDPAGIDALRAKLTAIESLTGGELVTAARTFLQV